MAGFFLYMKICMYVGAHTVVINLTFYNFTNSEVQSVAVCIQSKFT